ncbi:MAG: tetratricopeptide repeat protein [Candidatus Paceibacterota bacterium]
MAAEATAELTLQQGVEVFRRRWPAVQSSSDASPILLLAAGYRTGSTLLQRMLSRDCLMWGEPYGHGGLLDSAVDIFRRIRGFWPEEGFFFEGQDASTRATSFVANLYPSPRILLDSYVGFFENLFATPASEAGIDRWGMKTVRCSADHAFLLRWLFPQSKILFLIRNPYDAFRSYDTIRRERHVVWFNHWPDRPLDAREFGQHWRKLAASFIEHHEQLQAPLLYYEDLIARRCDLGALEQHLGVRVDVEALQTNPGQWPRPRAQIDDSDLAILQNEVEPLAEQLGYSNVASRSRVPTSGDKRPQDNLGPQASSPTQPPSLKAQTDAHSRTLKQAIHAHQSGDSATAERQCLTILREDPNHPGAWHLLGLLRLAERNYPEAHQHITRAIRLRRDKPAYHNNHGVVLLELGQHAAAEAAFRRALELSETYADAWSNLGHVQQLVGKPLKEAEKSLHRAISLQADHRDALMHLADLYRDHGRLDDAVSLWQRWIARYGADPTAYKKIGQAQQHRGRLRESQSAIEQAISLTPDDPELHLILGAVQAGLEAFDESKRAYHRAAALCPDRGIWRWKHLTACPSIFDDAGSIDRYWQDLHRGLDEAYDQRLAMDWRTLPQDGFAPPFNLPHHQRCCRDVKEKFTRLFRDAFPQTPPQPRPGLDDGRSVRVGFVVTAGHEAGFVRGTSRIIEKLDRSRFEPIVFCPARYVKRIRQSVRRNDVKIVPFRGRFDQVAATIRASECDLIYYWKVGADTWNLFLPLARLAPIQCTSWGTHGTSGVNAIDYYLSSPWMETTDPGVNIADHYTEQLALLPTFPTWQERQRRRKPVTRSTFGLPDKVALYFCPHRLPKYHPNFDAYLRGILEEDSSGHLVLLCGTLPGVQAALQRRLARNLGDSLCRRIHFMPVMAVDRYYQLLNLATVVLDSTAYAGGITAYDAFSFGIPVVTQPGRFAVQNYTAGLYRRMELTELIAPDQQKYVNLSVRLGTDTDYRHDVSQRLLEASELIFNAPHVTQAHESFFLSTVGVSDTAENVCGNPQAEQLPAPFI